jgi:hypothetical protein
MKSPSSSWFTQSPIKIVSNQKVGKPPTGRCRARQDSSVDVRKVIFDRLLSTAAKSMFENEDYSDLDTEQRPSIEKKFSIEHISDITQVAPSFNPINEALCGSLPKICRKVTFSDSLILGSSSGYSPSCSASIISSHQQHHSIIADTPQSSVEGAETKKSRIRGVSSPSKSREGSLSDCFLHHGNLDSHGMDPRPLTSLSLLSGDDFHMASYDCNGQQGASSAVEYLNQSGGSNLPTLDSSMRNLDSVVSSCGHPLGGNINSSHSASVSEQQHSDDEFLKYTAFLRHVHKKRASTMIQLLGAGLTDQTEDVKGYYYDGMGTDELEEKIFTKVVIFMK